MVLIGSQSSPPASPANLLSDLNSNRLFRQRRDSMLGPDEPLSGSSPKADLFGNEQEEFVAVSATEDFGDLSIHNEYEPSSKAALASDLKEKDQGSSSSQHQKARVKEQSRGVRSGNGSSNSSTRKCRKKPPFVAPPTYRNLIAVMGSTGSGKSTFINCVGDSSLMRVGHSSESCTVEVREATIRIGSHIVKLVDTPGFDDTNLSDTEVLRRIANWMEYTYALGVKLTGIIYLREITETRMKGSAIKNLDVLIKLCGTDALSNVVLVTTKWDALQNTSDGEDRETSLQQIYWRDPIEFGAKMARHYNTCESALKVIGLALGNPEIDLAIQKEIVDEKKPLVETAAGAAINGEVIELEKKLRRELNEKLAAKDKEHSETMRKINERQTKELIDKLEQVEKDRKALELSRDVEMKYLRQQVEDLKRAAAEAGKTVIDYVWTNVSNLGSMIRSWFG